LKLTILIVKVADVDIVERLMRLFDVEPIDGLPDAWHWSRIGFHYAAALTTDRRHLLDTSSRDRLDLALMRSVLKFGREHEAEVLDAAPLAVLEGFSAPGYRFDALVAAMPSVHRAFKAKDRELHAVTYDVYPAYRCEFSGQETEDEARYRFEDDVDLADYHREPNPFVRFRYLDTKNHGGSIGDERGFASLHYLIVTLKDLGGEGSFVEFENFRGEVRRVDWRDGDLILSGGGEQRRMELPELIDGVRHFMCPGMSD
jgi:hypothetical protein